MNLRIKEHYEIKKPKSYNLYVPIMRCITLQELLNKCSRSAYTV